jgi:hypothetical protein
MRQEIHSSSTRVLALRRRHPSLRGLQQRRHRQKHGYGDKGADRLIPKLSAFNTLPSGGHSVPNLHSSNLPSSGPSVPNLHPSYRPVQWSFRSKSTPFIPPRPVVLPSKIFNLHSSPSGRPSVPSSYVPSGGPSVHNLHSSYFPSGSSSVHSWTQVFNTADRRSSTN